MIMNTKIVQSIDNAICPFCLTIQKEFKFIGKPEKLVECENCKRYNCYYKYFKDKN